jgi:6-phosphogluconolactonase (cycloisomerase 2 family)
MSTRFTWLLGLAILVSIGLLAACGSHYSASSDGLVIVPSQGSAVVQSFSFNLSNGHTSQVNTNPTIPGPPDQGSQASIVLDPKGAFAYVTSVNTPNPATDPCTTSSVIATYTVKSDGTIAAIGQQTLSPTTQAVVPVALAIDSAGKYLFVANRSVCVIGNPQTLVPGSVSVFAIGSNASLAEVAGSPFPVPLVQGGGAANLVALAASPTVFPSQFAQCSMTTAPTAEFLYVTDAQNNVVWEFSVNTSSGALTLPATSFATGSIPSGIAIDPCNRFAYIANENSNNVSAYTVCASNSPLQTCSNQTGSLVAVAGSPFSAGNGPGPLVVSPFGNFLYVLDKSGSAVSAFQISQASGSLSPISPATVATGNTPVSIAIRADSNWLFVTNNGSTSGNGSISQYSITPATGSLNPAGSGITTDTFPWGVAVK